MVFLRKLSWLILIIISITIGFYYKPGLPDTVDIVFTIYVLLVASLFSNNLNSIAILSTVLPYTLYTQSTFAPFLIGLGVLLRIGKISLKRRISQALVFFATTAISILIASIFIDLYLHLTIFSLSTILIYMFLNYLSGEQSHTTFDEIIYILFFVLSTAIIAGLRMPPPAFAFSIYPVGLSMYLRTLSFKNTLKIYKSQHERFQQFREKLAALIELTNTVSQKSTVHQSLSMVTEAVSQISGYRYVLINILDRESGKIFRAAHHGLSQAEFERLKSNPPPIEYISRFMQERFKISNSYFVPQGALELPAEYVATLLNSHSDLFNEPDAWKPDDMLIIPVYSPNQDLIGYISVDAPIHGKRPSIEDVQIMELIASQVYKLLERSEAYQSIVVRQPYDQHTLLLTHSAFLGVLESECQKGQPFAVAIIDIDDLTRINSQYGHETGDRIIEKIAEILKNKTRKSDVAARYGGEEFAIILRNVSKSKAIEIIDRILDEIRKIQDTVNVTASAGIGIFPDHGSDYRSIMKYALKALEIAKKSGKDRFMVL
ncbi:MAG TPA: diguanylate cyclase [Pseudothermotoga sp.]